MSTRAVIVLTGFNEYPPGRETARLYKHWDGYPSDTLALLARMIRRAGQYIAAHADDLRRFTPTGRVPTVADLPVLAAADLAIGESVEWGGATARLDTDPDGGPSVPRLGDPDLRRAHYPGGVTATAFGRQGDVEWVYLVDLPRREVTVWATPGEPEECLASPATDPRVSADYLRREARAPERARVERAMDALVVLEWTITPPGKPAPAAPNARPRRGRRPSTTVRRASRAGQPGSENWMG
jgi:hypothetical protein